MKPSHDIGVVVTRGDYFSGAIFSPDKKYRYCLWRSRHQHIDPPLKPHAIMFVGLNPSTANESTNDPTVTRCMNFSWDWGYDFFFMMNVFALRSTDPKLLYTAHQPRGLLNPFYIQRVAQKCNAAVCCWGNHGKYCNAGKHVEMILRYKSNIQIFHFGLTNENQPKHPLYLPKDNKIIKWE